MLYYHLGLFIPHAIAVRTAQELGNGYSFGNDFYQVWITAREWQRRKVDPYSTEMTREIQIGLNGRPLDAQRRSDPQDERRFPYPAFVDLLFWPAADFPFTSVRVVVSGSARRSDGRKRALVAAGVRVATRLEMDRCRFAADALQLPSTRRPVRRAVGIAGCLFASRFSACVTAQTVSARRNSDGPHDYEAARNGAGDHLFLTLGVAGLADKKPLLRGIHGYVGAAGGNFAGGDAALDSFLDQYGHGISRLQSGTSGKDGSDFPVGAATCRSGSIVRHGRVPHRCRIRGLAASRRWRRIIRILAHDGPAALHYHDRHSSRAGGLRSRHSASRHLVANPFQRRIVQSRAGSSRSSLDRSGCPFLAMGRGLRRVSSPRIFCDGLRFGRVVSADSNGGFASLRGAGATGGAMACHSEDLSSRVSAVLFFTGRYCSEARASET